ncbi:MAG TPA: tetratricopeptide repeat protein [Phycisphaerae bacterium]|nr:tetratricopeptide repeat protein [Phycisphaerae bacterium]
MSSRWFIPASLAIFSGFVALLWFYLAATQPPTTVSSAPEKESAIDRELDALTSRSRPDPPTEAPPPIYSEPVVLARHSRPPAPLLRQIGARWAEQLDEASVTLRNDVSHTGIALEAKARHAAAAGDHEAALRHLEETLAKNPRDTAALSAKAASLVALERFAEAAEVYETTVRLAPIDSIARYNYAVVLWRLSRFDAAARELREVVRLAPDHADAQYNLASLAQRDGRLTEARTAWEAFTRLRPEAPSGWFNLGVVYMDFDEPESAANAFARFTQLAPSDPDGWINLALAEAAADHLDAALYALTIADELAPCEALTLDLLAQIHELLAERVASSAETHRVAADELRALLEWPDPPPVESVAGGENN